MTLHSAFELNQFHFLSLNALDGFESACLMTGEGDVLALKYQNLTDIGTLPTAAETSYKYLASPEGNVVLINDPYSGGSTLFSMILVYAVQDIPRGKGGGNPTRLLLCARVAFKPRLVFADSIEAEGIRIPPTPIFQEGSLNEQLLDVISQHPLAPASMQEILREKIELIRSKGMAFKKQALALGMDWSKKHIKSYFEETAESFKRHLHQYRMGETTLELELDKNSKIKLTLEISEDFLRFDFSGTTPSNYFSLTSPATLGACLGALIAPLNVNVPINSGILRMLEVVTPDGSLVNAKYPSPVYLGMTDGASVIASLVLKALGKLDPALKLPQSGVSQCAFELDFGASGFFFETLESGVAASPSSSGAPGLDIWKRSHLEPSIEEVERRYPLTIKTYSLRPHSGGSGEKLGGDGVTKVIQVTETAKFKWMLTDIFSKPEGANGGKSAHGPEIFVVRKDNKQKLEHRGSMELYPGDEIVVHSSGGGGFGEKS